MSTAVCPLCTGRKGRRACPAVGHTICPVCCGTKRLTEIACPPSCAYLSSARTYPAAVIQRRQERDLRFILPLAEGLSETQFQLLLIFQAVAVRHARTALPPLLDADVADAAAASAATLETAGKGIIYEHHAASMPAQRLTVELNRGIDDVRQKAGSAAPALERDMVIALRRLEQAARTAAAALEGDEPPVYLRLALRMMEQAGSDPAPGQADSAPGTSAGASRIVLP